VDDGPNRLTTTHLSMVYIGACLAMLPGHDIETRTLQHPSDNAVVQRQGREGGGDWQCVGHDATER